MFEVGVVGPFEYCTRIGAADFRAVEQICVLWIASPLSAKRIQNLNRTNQIVEITRVVTCVVSFKKSRSKYYARLLLQ